ncbi:MAG: protein kinase domain-containing protein [Hydrogeniiclostridium sp.]
MLNRGDILGNVYQIVGEIGAGGTGVVYKAYHLRLRRYVVVKKIKDEVAARINARAEADILKRIKHTYLPQVYDFLEIDGGVYTVIDFIEGQPLDYYIKQGYRIQQKQIILWARQLCEALVYLHGLVPPIIHSDIKPQNIMITPQGNVCLIDFNISLDGQGSSQISGMSAGYAPPEQYLNASPPPQGNATGASYSFQMAAPLDARSDIYSLGATLYHLLSGRKPEKSTGPVTPITSLGLPYSQALLEVVERMMQPDPNGRYQTAAELLRVFCDLRKLDKRYTHHRAAQHTVTVVFSALLVGSLLLSFFGYRQMGVEKEERYGILVAQGQEAGENGDYEEAISLYDEAINLFSTKIPAYYEKLLAYVEQGEYEACVQYGRMILTNPGLETAMEEDPKAASGIYFMIGNAWFEQESYLNAVEYYKEAVAQNTENPEYYRDYAIALARMQQTEEAEKILDEAVSLGLDTDSVTLVQAELELAAGQWQPAAEKFMEAVRSTSSETLRQRAYILCARAYRLGEQPDKEIAVLEEARNTIASEKNGPVLTALGAAYMRRAQIENGHLKSDCEKALECYELVMKQGNRSAAVRLNIAALYQMLERYEEAENILLELRDELPEDYRPYMRLAILYGTVENGQPEEERDYTKVQENYEKAVAYYQKAKNDGVSDAEMQLLETMMQQIIDGGWLYND